MTLFIGQLFAVITAVCWAQNSLIYSHSGKIIGSKTVTHIRLWLALPMIMIAHLVVAGSLFPLGLQAKSYLIFSLSGVVGFCIADLFIFQAFVDLGPRQTMVILTTSPIFSAVLSRIFYKENLLGIQIIGILVTLIGVCWVVIADGKNERKKKAGKKLDGKGVLIALAGSLAQAGGVILSKGGLEQGVHPVSANVIRLTAGLAALIIYAAVRGKFVADFRKVIQKSGRKLLGLIAFAAAVGPVMGIILNLYALSIVPAGIVSALTQTTPIILLPYERFIQKKTITVGAILGTIAAILGIFLLFAVKS